MKTLVLCAVTVMALGIAGGAASEAPSGGPGAISGAGASFPAPLYSAWADKYHAAGGDAVTYQSVGSGAGIQQIEASAVDFGATDKPLTAEDLASQGLLQFPTVLGGVVPVINAPGIGAGQLRLDGPLLAEVFAGHVKMWNDPRIKALNPALALPDLPITVAYRSDKSGTTFLFTTYLSAVSAAWKAGPGSGDAVAWPAGLGGKGNAGVAEIMGNTLGTIGYVEYAYARQNNLDYVVLKNSDGSFVAADAAGFTGAAAKADWSRAKGFYLLLIDQPGAASWPITGATFILVRKDAPAARRQAVLRFFDWAYAKGDANAVALGYVPLPVAVKTLIRTSWGPDAPRP